MADGGHDKKRGYQVEVNDRRYVFDIDRLIFEAEQKRLNEYPVAVNKENSNATHNKSSPENLHSDNMNREWPRRNIKLCDTPKETTPSLGSLLIDSHSVVDYEIDQLFKEILNECSDVTDSGDSESSSVGGAYAPAAATPSCRSSKSSPCFMGLKQNSADKNDQPEPVFWQCGDCGSSNSSTSQSSSSLSSVDDFEDAESPDDFVMFEDFDMMHSDWDSGLSSNNNSHLDMFDDDDDDWSVAISILGNFPGFDTMRMRQQWSRNGEAPPSYPHRALMYHECQVCLTRSLLRRRVCCDFHICAECMSTYVSMKVNEAKVQIECPNDRCSVLIHRDEVNERLPKDMKDKFAKFLVDANTDPHKKTCPACSEIYNIDPKLLSVKKKKLKLGLQVRCPQCSLLWCFLCQAPYHTKMTCKQHRKGDRMVEKWAKEVNAGQSNAQRCPKCKIFIQKVNGCDHMKCTKCNTDFCYRCGDRYISVKLLGNHWSKFSLFGCKYRLMPQKPALRRLIRGANFAARLVAGVMLAGLGLAAGAVLVGASVIIVPSYGIFRLRRHLQLRERRNKTRQTIGRLVDREFRRVILMPREDTIRTNTEADVENLDTQQVQVIVHRPVNLNHEDAESARAAHMDENCEFYINKYTTEGTDMVVSGVGHNDSDNVIVLTEVTEIQNEDGYPTVVAHIVSKVASEQPSKTKLSNKDTKEEECNPCIGKTDLLRHSVKMRKPREDLSDTGVTWETSLPTEIFSSDVSLRKNSTTTAADIPSCSWENLSDRAKVDSGFGDSDSCQEVNVSESKPASLAVGDDTNSTKSSNNGCFGNIFSRRVPTSQTVVEYPAGGKAHIPNPHKKSLSYKASTWEKCHRDYVQSVLKSSPLDPMKDFNNLTSVMQKSPASSFDAMDIVNREMKYLQTYTTKHSQKSSEVFKQDKDKLHTMAYSTSLGNSSEDGIFSMCQNRSEELVGKLEDSADQGDLHCGGCYISTCSEITHL